MLGHHIFLFAFLLALLGPLELARVVPVGDGVILRRARGTVMLLDIAMTLLIPGRRAA